MEGRLLLVDDDPGVLDLLNEYFAGQGYDVEVATSGEVALCHLRRQDATLPVIMVTANEDVTLARKTLNIGAFDYVATPFDLAAARACFAGQGDAARIAGSPRRCVRSTACSPWAKASSAASRPPASRRSCVT